LEYVTVYPWSDPIIRDEEGKFVSASCLEVTTARRSVVEKYIDDPSEILTDPETETTIIWIPDLSHFGDYGDDPEWSDLPENIRMKMLKEWDDIVWRGKEIKDLMDEQD